MTRNKENKLFTAPLELLWITLLKGTSVMVMMEVKALLFHFSHPGLHLYSVNVCFLFVLSSQDVKSRRNPRLVPYILLDERTKKSNKDSLREAVRTLLGYGYNLEAPDQDHGRVPTLHCITMIFNFSIFTVIFGENYYLDYKR